MKLIIVVITTLVLIGCGNKPNTEVRNTKVSEGKPTVYTPKTPKKVEMGMKLWKNFGVVGSVYKPTTTPGTVDGLEGGLLYFKTLTGPVWFVNFEPEDNRGPLDKRRIYLVRISSDTKKGCGSQMDDYKTAPEQCVMEEKIFTWSEAKSFLQPKVRFSPDRWARLEKFLRDRE